MDTVVVIPTDLSLVLSAGDFWSMNVGVSNTHTLTPGMIFYPDEGQVRLDKLEVYKRLKPTDIRFRFGCFDDIHEVEDRDVRHCNWIRFLESSANIDDVNIVAAIVGGQPIFQVVKEIPPNSKILAFFETGEENDQPVEEMVTRKTENENETDKQVDPLNVSLGISERSCSPIDAISVSFISADSPMISVDTEKSSPSISAYDASVSTTDQSNVSDDKRPTLSSIATHFASPTTDPDDDNKSVISDVTNVSEESQHTVKDTSTERGQLHSPDIIGPGHNVPKHPLVDAPRESTPVMRPPVKRNRERTWLPCEVCGKTFDRPSLLRRHMRTHTGEKPHACDVCGKAFSTSSSLNTHRRIHSGEKPHQCQVCGKRFTASSNLYYHRMTHNKEKPHACKLCAKSFPTPGDLKSHMYVHTGTWPFKCDVCNRGFSKQTNLKNHMLLHTGDKPHECRLCGKRFALQCNLRTHLKTHDGETQDECLRCGRMFPTDSRQNNNGYCSECHDHPAVRKLQTSPREDAGIGRQWPESGPTNSKNKNRPNNSEKSSTGDAMLRTGNHYSRDNPSQNPHVSSAHADMLSRDRSIFLSQTPNQSLPAMSHHRFMSASSAMFPPFYPMSNMTMHPGTGGMVHYSPGINWPSMVTQRY